MRTKRALPRFTRAVDRNASDSAHSRRHTAKNARCDRHFWRRCFRCGCRSKGQHASENVLPGNGGCGLDTCRLAVAIDRYFGDCGENFALSMVRIYSSLPFTILSYTIILLDLHLSSIILPEPDERLAPCLVTSMLGWRYLYCEPAKTTGGKGGKGGNLTSDPAVQKICSCRST